MQVTVDRNQRKPSSGRRMPMPRKRDREGKQGALLRAAKDLFATQGFEGTTTREIAYRAGCAEGLIHRYFQGKEGLLLALMRECAEQMRRQLEEDSPAGNLKTEIQRLLEFEVESLWGDREFFRVAVSRAVVDPEVGRFLSRVCFTQRVKTIRKRVQKVQGNRASRKEEQSKVIAQAISALGFALGFLRHVVFEINPKETRKLTSQVAQMLYLGMEHA